MKSCQNQLFRCKRTFLRATANGGGSARRIDFAVEEGEVFGLLGPNGAGKTTTVEILEGMRTPDRGLARVCGLDPERSGAQFKGR